MQNKLTTSRPAQAVDTPDNSMGVDGDSGGAAGTSLAGVGAVSALGNQPCEIPFQFQFTGADAELTASRHSQTSRTASHRAAWAPGMTGDLGNAPLHPGGVAAR